MPATITGTVFNDLNHNGQLNPGEPGIPDVFLTLFNTSTMSCVQTSTDANGVYSFSVATAGTYRIYETVESAVGCPPTTFTQPDGFTLSNGPRVLTVTVTAAQVTNNATIGSQNFSHDTIDDSLACSTTLIQFVNEPTNWYNIDVVTGVATFEGLLVPPDSVNAIGYNILDNYIYGYDQTTHHIVRVDNNRTLMQLVPNPPGLPSNDFNVGSFDLNGHLFLMVNNTARFYTVDLTPNSATFMKLVDPTNGFVEQTSNFGTALSTTLNVSDWAFNPNTGFLYGVTSVGNTSQVMRVNPTTGAVAALTTTAPVLNPTGRSWGAVAMDGAGNLFAIYNGDGGVFRYIISGNTAVGTRISTTFTTSFNDATMCPTAVVGPIADIEVVKTESPDPAIPGEQIEFTIIVSNNGPDSANNVTLIDDISSQINSPEYNINGGAFLPWPGTLNLGTFALGASNTIIIRGIVDPTATGTITNTAIVNSSAEDPNPDNNTSTVVVPIAALAADMEVIKTASPNPVIAGEQIEFTITVSNLGPNDAQNVILTDIIPSQIADAEFSTDGGVTFDPWNGSVVLGTFTDGESETIIIRGTVSSGATGTISNTAIVSSATPDPNPNNNTSTIDVLVAESADIAILKTASPNPVAAGDQVTFTMTVSNLGPSDSQNVILTDVIPAQITGAEVSTDGGMTFTPWTGSLNLGTIVSNTSETVIIRGTVSSSTNGTITNTATVSSITPDPNPENNTSTVNVSVIESADISVVKTATPSSVIPGGMLVYSIVVSNLGPSDAQNVTLTDAIPPQIAGAEFSTDGGVTFLPWTGSANIGTLTAGTFETIIIRGTVNTNTIGTITNTAVVSSTTPDPNPTNNTSTVIINICDARCQAIAGLIESVALEQAGLARILDAEGQKIQTMIATPNVSVDILLRTNKSVQSMTSAIALLETILSSKLTLFKGCLCCDSKSCID